MKVESDWKERQEKAWAAYVWARDHLVSCRIDDSRGITNGARSKLFEEAMDSAVCAYAAAWQSSPIEILERLAKRNTLVVVAVTADKFLYVTWKGDHFTYMHGSMFISREEAVNLLVDRPIPLGASPG